MITRIEIQNFKGIGKKQTIDLKPITLLFGPNSAGKSTVLHAFQYAREVFERRNLNADRTLSGGSLVDLGGFEAFVHGHRKGELVRFRFEMDLSDATLPEYIWSADDRDRFGSRGPTPEGTSAAGFPGTVASPQLAAEMRTAWVEIAVGWSDLRESCYVSSYSVGVNGEAVAKIACDYGRRLVEIRDLNLMHPLFQPGFAAGEYCDAENDSMMGFWLRETHGDDNLSHRPLYLDGQPDALPHWGQVLQPLLQTLESLSSEEVKDPDRFHGLEASLLIGTLTQLMVGPGEVLRDSLAKYFYLGPLRDVPSRNHASARFHDPARWANGMAAWDLLYQNGDDFLEAVSDWLSSAEKLDAGYRLESTSYREINASSPLMGLLLSELPPEDFDDLRDLVLQLPLKRRLTLISETPPVEVLPQDVGVGIAQLLPVVVMLLDERPSLIAIEQPELHLHPKVQVGLGDLLIKKIATDPSARCLIETHSEHLLLRLLRRIRETGDGTLPPGSPVTLHPNQVSVMYVESSEVGTRFVPLRIDETGEFIDRWPRGFFEERAGELF